MIKTSHFPKIMIPGELEQLNLRALRKLGTPLFFVSTNLPRPYFDDANNVYEVVTGLYVIYYDYGIRILESFLEFCQKDADQDPNKPTAWHKSMKIHYGGIKKLRHFFCHGNLRNGGYAKKIRRVMNYYFPDKENIQYTWPDHLMELSQTEFEQMLGKLCKDADMFFDRLDQCITEVGEDAERCSRWKTYLIQKVFNAEEPQYGTKQYQLYFDERIIYDVEKAIPGSYDREMHQYAVSQWLKMLKDAIEEGLPPDTDYLRRTLYDTLYRLHKPQKVLPDKSSIDRFGIDLPHIDMVNQ